MSASFPLSTHHASSFLTSPIPVLAWPSPPTSEGASISRLSGCPTRPKGRRFSSVSIPAEAPLVFLNLSLSYQQHDHCQGNFPTTSLSYSSSFDSNTRAAKPSATYNSAVMRVFSLAGALAEDISALWHDTRIGGPSSIRASVRMSYKNL